MKIRVRRQNRTVTSAIGRNTLGDRKKNAIGIKAMFDVTLKKIRSKTSSLQALNGEIGVVEAYFSALIYGIGQCRDSEKC